MAGTCEIQDQPCCIGSSVSLKGPGLLCEKVKLQVLAKMEQEMEQEQEWDRTLHPIFRSFYEQ